MIRFLFLIPIVLCVLWWVYLSANGHSFKDGRKGFIYILIVSAFIAIVYSLLLWITGRQF